VSTRRHLLQGLAILPATLAVSRLGSAAELQPTPACGTGNPTPRQTAGPYYKPSSPQRRNLRTGISRGEPIDLSGLVLDTRCRPLADVIVEIWHADDGGRYDNSGFRLRGWQRTDSGGHWAFDTIVPQFYSVRTAHFHFRVQPSDGGPLITQLYFPDHPRNARDGIFDTRLLMTMAQAGKTRTGRFDFVLES